jgi:hypothetical protein
MSKSNSTQLTLTCFVVFKISGLYDEINDLSNQIDRLSDEIGKFK